MATDSTSEGARVESTTSEDPHWGKISLAVFLSFVLALGSHYLLLGNIDMHPTLHALVGVGLFFVAGFVTFQIVVG